MGVVVLSNEASDWSVYPTLPIVVLPINNSKKGGITSAFQFCLWNTYYFKPNLFCSSFDKAALGNTKLIVLIAK
jgi:hypothetical protein